MSRSVTFPDSSRFPALEILISFDSVTIFGFFEPLDFVIKLSIE